MRASLVTGGGRGIGRAVAHALGGPGTIVAVAGRTRAQLQATAADLEGLGGRALALEMDVTDEASAAAAMQALRNTLPALDVLANTASVGGGEPGGRPSRFASGR